MQGTGTVPVYYMYGRTGTGTGTGTLGPVPVCSLSEDLCGQNALSFGSRTIECRGPGWHRGADILVAVGRVETLPTLTDTSRGI